MQRENGSESCAFNRNALGRPFGGPRGTSWAQICILVLIGSADFLLLALCVMKDILCSSVPTYNPLGNKLQAHE